MLPSLLAVLSSGPSVIRPERRSTVNLDQCPVATWAASMGRSDTMVQRRVIGATVGLIVAFAASSAFAVADDFVEQGNPNFPRVSGRWKFVLTPLDFDYPPKTTRGRPFVACAFGACDFRVGFGTYRLQEDGRYRLVRSDATPSGVCVADRRPHRVLV